jgi:3-hydroxyacyl-CoA dehydrogenase
MLDKLLTDVSVIGAAGKMGRGIATLLLEEMSNTEMRLTGNVGSFRLNLIDSNLNGFHELKTYLRDQTLKYAEKNINQLRKTYLNNLKLISNREIIEFHVKKVMDSVFCNDSIETSASSFLIFEAIVEDKETKAKLFSTIQALATHPVYFFTNTSSIPIHVLEESSNLKGNIIGFHFYNPPVVQKLVEVIIPENCEPELCEVAEELINRLKKTAVYSSDIAGFIGNGHFMQEIVYACQKAREFGTIHSYMEGVYLINTVTKDFLLRPMGIFQLMDYVGIDVCSSVLKVMQQYLPQKKLHDELIDWMVLEGKLGGQTKAGEQLPGFFEYEKNHLKSIFSIEQKKYVPLDTISKSVLEHLGERPNFTLSWKSLQNDIDKNKKLEKYFKDLRNGQTLGDELAYKWLLHSKHIGDQLVSEHIAGSFDDVDKILMNGFYHIYGINCFGVIENEEL